MIFKENFLPQRSLRFEHLHQSMFQLSNGFMICLSWSQINKLVYHSGISKSAPSSNHAFQTIAEIAFFCSNLKVAVDDCDCEEYPSA